jgi:hypothetical protein
LCQLLGIEPQERTDGWHFSSPRRTKGDTYHCFVAWTFGRYFLQRCDSGCGGQCEGPRIVPMPRVTKPMAITNRNTSDQIGSPRTTLLNPSSMKAPPIQTYHHPSIRARRYLLSMTERFWRTTQVCPVTWRMFRQAVGIGMATRGGLLFALCSAATRSIVRHTECTGRSSQRCTPTFGSPERPSGARGRAVGEHVDIVFQLTASWQVRYRRRMM